MVNKPSSKLKKGIADEAENDNADENQQTDIEQNKKGGIEAFELMEQFTNDYGKDNDALPAELPTENKDNARLDRFGVEIVSRTRSKELNKRSGHKLTFVD